MNVSRGCFVALLLTACNGCNSEPIKYYDGGPPSDGNTDMDGTTNGDGGGGMDASAPSLCDPKTMYGAAMAVSGVAAGDKMFGAITPDELTIAWIAPNGTVSYADRTDKGQPFGNAQSLQNTFEHDRVALSSDGLTLIVVMTGAKSFAQVTRTARAMPFGGTPDTMPFSMILVPFMSEDGGVGMGNVGDPVLSADGKQLFFSIFNAGTRETVAFSEKVSTQWGKPTTLKQMELASSGGKRRRPTGISSDGRTLFWWDEVDGKEKAGWRGSTKAFDLTFSGIVDLGDKKDAQPVAKCDRLYFTNPPAAPSDVKLADKQ